MDDLPVDNIVIFVMRVSIVFARRRHYLRGVGNKAHT